MTILDENLSDEELLNMEAPVFTASEPDPVVDPTDDGQGQADLENDTPKTEGDEGQEDEGDDDAGGAEGDDKEGKQPEADAPSDADMDKQEAPASTPAPKPAEDKPAAPVEGEKPVDEKKETPKEGDKPTEGAKPADDEAVIDYKAEYEKLIGTPIKANGKDITLKNVDEVRRLVQQGAGYAHKMEQLKPARKAASMLESAGLLGDENALGHMIDLYNGDPKAIAKMVKDLNIDIFALDLDAGAQYTPASHLQTDEAVIFQDTLKEVRTLEGGREALALIDTMDAKSKDMIWGNPVAVRQIYDFKQNGVYDTVATEIERRRALGQIPEGEPFIVSFQAVGEDLAKAAIAAEPDPATVQPTTPTPEPAKPAPVRTPVASGPAPRKAVVPDARAAAAASPRGGVGQAKQTIDIFALSDADFEKMSAPPQS